MKKIDLNKNEITSIIYDDKQINIKVEDGALVITSNINCDVIDKNFNELESKIDDINAQIRLRFIGELNKLKVKIEEISNHE
jgi:hypothetical protein